MTYIYFIIFIILGYFFRKFIYSKNSINIISTFIEWFIILVISIILSLNTYIDIYLYIFTLVLLPMIYIFIKVYFIKNYFNLKIELHYQKEFFILIILLLLSFELSLYIKYFLDNYLIIK